MLAVFVAVLTGTTLKEPERKSIGENTQSSRKKVSLFKVLTQPRIILLAIAASIRHSGGMTFAYNADLYYSIYFPDVDLGWWLFAVTIGIGKFRKYTLLIAMDSRACCTQNSVQRHFNIDTMIDGLEFFDVFAHFIENVAVDKFPSTLLSQQLAYSKINVAINDLIY